MSRSQRLVLTFFITVWAALIVILLIEPSFYEASLAPLGMAPSAGVDIAFVGTVTVFLVLLSLRVVAGSRLVFWLVLVAFAAGVLRVPASALQLGGALPLDGPAWYAVLQAVIGVIQFLIALVMWREYRDAGVWGVAHPRVSLLEN